MADTFIPDWKSTPLSKNSKFPLVVAQRAKLAAKIKELEAERRALGDSLQALLLKSEVDVVAIEGFTPLRITTAQRSKVDEGKVKHSLINDCKLKLSTVERIWEAATVVSTSSYITGGAAHGESE